MSETNSNAKPNNFNAKMQALRRNSFTGCTAEFKGNSPGKSNQEYRTYGKMLGLFINIDAHENCCYMRWEYLLLRRTCK